MSKAKEKEMTDVINEPVEEIIEFPEQNTFNADDMSVIEEEVTEDENKNK